MKSEDLQKLAAQTRCYYAATKVLCQYNHDLAILNTFCPVQHTPPISALAERSVVLANSLRNADVSAPTRFVQAKTSIIELRMRILYSDN
ncbi:unnamed protein product [Adineta ricciae]|uniref:Uncharacterized protein n=1 Tax=Adineta ricciae TaxID=249248 RepID=A0A815SUU3_ADIRI|nr:unnamed protein product [Adineta ricciae]